MARFFIKLLDRLDCLNQFRYPSDQLSLTSKPRETKNIFLLINYFYNIGKFLFLHLLREMWGWHGCCFWLPYSLVTLSKAPQKSRVVEKANICFPSQQLPSDVSINKSETRRRIVISLFRSFKWLYLYFQNIISILFHKLLSLQNNQTNREKPLPTHR